MTPILAWIQIIRLGLVQASIGAIVVFATSTLNRVMVVEFALPAIIPGLLVAFHYGVQMLRPRWGFASDRQGRRTPWIVGGMTVLAAGGILAAFATGEMPRDPVAGFALALLAFALIGIGVGAAGTSLLVLLARQAGERRRAAAATLVWMMMIAGFIVTAAAAGRLLDPFSIERLMQASVIISGAALLIALLAVSNLEPTERSRAGSSTSPSTTVRRWTGGVGVDERTPPGDRSGREESLKSPPRGTIGDELTATGSGFRAVLGEVWAEPETRRFSIFVFLSMLAYSAQELIFEPFAGSVFALSPAGSAKLAGLQHSGLLAGMVVVAILGSAVGGPRLGSMRLWTTGGCLASAAAALGIAATGLAGSPGPLRVAVFALGLANGAFSISAIGAMMQLSGAGRPGREGVRMGLWGAAQAVAFALGGLGGTSASDLARHLLGSAGLAYGLIFAAEAVLFCWAASLAAKAFPRRAGAVIPSLRGALAIASVAAASEANQ